MTKMVALREVKQGLSGYVSRLRKGDRLIITVRGKPAALLTGLDPGADLEDVFTESDPEIWRMLKERMKDPRPGIPLEELKRQLAAEPQRRRAPAAKKAPARRAPARKR